MTKWSTKSANRLYWSCDTLSGTPAHIVHSKLPVGCARQKAYEVDIFHFVGPKCSKVKEILLKSDGLLIREVGTRIIVSIILYKIICLLRSSYREHLKNFHGLIQGSSPDNYGLSNAEEILFFFDMRVNVLMLLIIVWFCPNPNIKNF